MPTFNQDDFEIDIDEFIDCCSSEEIKELVSSLKERGFLNTVSHEHANINDIFWSETIAKLEKSRLLLTSEEEEIINKIASRFIL